MNLCHEMVDIYAFVIPIKELDRFLLVNFRDYVLKFSLKCAFESNKCSTDESKYYFFPFAQCFCADQGYCSECWISICSRIKLNMKKFIGYAYISSRMVNSKCNYKFYALLFQSVKISELDLDGVDYTLFSPDMNDVAIFGPEVLISINYLNCTSSNIFLPSDNLQIVSFNLLLEKFNKSNWLANLFRKNTLDIQEDIYVTFMRYSYPCFKMNFTKFSHFMLNHKVATDDIPHYFRSFDVANEGFIGFQQFLVGVACMDFDTVHGGQTGELRSRYIFSFYDRNMDGFLDSKDIKCMLNDINIKKNKLIDCGSVDKIFDDAKKSFGIDAKNPCIDQEKFLTVIGNLQFRGTSVLFRFPPETSFSYLRKTVSSFDDCMKFEAANNDFNMNSNESSDYTLAVHSVKVRKKGDVVCVKPIWDDIQNCDQLGEFGDKFNVTYERLNSIDRFDKGSCPNEILQALVYFRQSDNMHNKCEMSWGDINMQQLANYLYTLCDDVLNIFMKEPRILEISSPAYVLGDLHGNYSDLVAFEETLWKLGVGLSGANYLFLGDYVDRGKFGIEVIAYLFAQKVLNPTQFFLLRGNHEIRCIQEQFTFKNECIDKFGLQCGTQLWETVNNVFDALPLVAVIDGKLFCVHGGIPRPSLLVTNTEYHCYSDSPMSCLKAAINNIVCPMSNPETESSLAWEIMWSDPDRNSSDEKLNSTELYSDVDDFGFTKNLQRKTASCFTEAALDKFLTKYNFTHVIRAHEVQKIGFNIEHQAKLVTVFSSSFYCRNFNEAACVFASRKKLRLIRLDASDC